MFVDKAGEHIADIMTMNRSYASIPSASSILDTSNYTFQAISYGKDSNGFRYHAHSILSPSGDGIIKVISYGSNSFSGYSTSTTALALSEAYYQLPTYPTPLDFKLEINSTLPNYSSGVANIGQCLNPIISNSLSSLAHLIGCFPAASGSKYQIFNSSGGLIVSGMLYSSIYNLSGLMDASGFLTFNPSALNMQQYAYANADTNSELFNRGVIRSAESGFPSEVDLKWIIPPGECGALNLFGGVYHLGLWCLDIKEMIKLGYNPPYSFNALNNIRKYRLFCKKTFNKDLITYTSNDAFKTLFETPGAGWSLSPVYGMVVKWKIRFI